MSDTTFCPAYAPAARRPGRCSRLSRGQVDAMPAARTIANMPALTVAGSAGRPMHHPNRRCPPPSMPESLPRPLAAYVAGCGCWRGCCNGTTGAPATGTSRRRACGANRRPHTCRAPGASWSISWDRRTYPVDAAPHGLRTAAGDRPTPPKRCRAFRPEQSQRLNQQTVIVLDFDIGFARAWVDDRLAATEPQTTNPVNRPVTDHRQQSVPCRFLG